MTPIYDALRHSAPLRPAADQPTGPVPRLPGPTESAAPAPDLPPPLPRPTSPPTAGTDAAGFPMRVLRTARRPPWQAGLLP